MAEDIKSELVKLNTMMEHLVKLQEEQTYHLREIDKVVRVGNGKPPLTERVALLEDSVGDNAEKIAENKGFIMKSLTAFGVAATGLITAATSWFNGG